MLIIQSADGRNVTGWLARISPPELSFSLSYSVYTHVESLTGGWQDMGSLKKKRETRQ